MPFIDHAGLRLHVRIDGISHRLAPTLVFGQALGTDLRLWDDIIPLLPDHLRLIRYDMRGHGQSDVPPAPYAMGQLISDAEAICDALQVRDAVFVGHGLGGMVAQGLAVKRLDILRGLVLCNTAARIGHVADWDKRIAAVTAGGMAAVSDAIIDRWFHPTAAARTLWRDRLLTTPAQGYSGGASAIAGSDFYTTTASLRLATLGIAGSEDRATPPDLVRETIDLIPGAQFKVIRRAGHLPQVDQPATFAQTLNDFLTAIGHD